MFCEASNVIKGKRRLTYFSVQITQHKIYVKLFNHIPNSVYAVSIQMNGHFRLCTPHLHFGNQPCPPPTSPIAWRQNQTVSLMSCCDLLCSFYELCLLKCLLRWCLFCFSHQSLWCTLFPKWPLNTTAFLSICTEPHFNQFKYLPIVLSNNVGVGWAVASNMVGSNGTKYVVTYLHQTGTLKLHPYKSFIKIKCHKDFHFSPKQVLFHTSVPSHSQSFRCLRHKNLCSYWQRINT